MLKIIHKKFSLLEISCIARLIDAEAIFLIMRNEAMRFSIMKRAGLFKTSPFSGKGKT